MMVMVMVGDDGDGGGDGDGDDDDDDEDEEDVWVADAPFAPYYARVVMGVGVKGLQ